MTDDAPVPLVPPEVDLRDFQFMPLDIARLRRSKAWLIAKRRPDIGFYMMNLWASSWHEVPAASLEDDDDVLADVAMCDPNHWSAVKEDALRGWIKCIDGRLYHPVVAEKAIEAWNQKAVYRWRKECDRIRKSNKDREKKGLSPLELPPQPAEVVWKSAGKSPNSKGKSDSSEGTYRHSDGGRSEVGRNSGGLPAEIPKNPAENALKGQGQGQGDSDFPDEKSESGRAGARDGTLPIFDTGVVSLRAVSRAKRQKKPETAWPHDFEFTAERRGFAEGRGYRGSQADDLWQVFRDKAAAKGWTYCDWPAAWRTFVMQQVKFDSQYRSVANAPRGRPPDV